MLIGLFAARWCLVAPLQVGQHLACERRRVRVGAVEEDFLERSAAKEAPPQKLRRVARGAVPTVAVVGRPNVGKSTLVNRMCDAGTVNGAIVRDEPGVTRDRVYQRATWGGRDFEMIDTGGLLFDDEADALFLEEIREQASLALSESCAAILVVDGREGPTRVDEEIGAFLRKWPRDLPVVVAVNKCEQVLTEAEGAAEFWRLGLGEPIACSGVHGNGVAEVLDALLPAIDGATRRDAPRAERAHVDVAILGRPNVGKSCLLNRFLGVQRSIVSSIPGTTRDAVDESVVVDGHLFKFVDTAGVRRKARVRDPTEEAMVGRSLRAVRRADLVLLVVDSTVEPTDQDAALAERIAADGRACVVLANKWDIKQDKTEKSTREVSKILREALAPVAWAEILFVSALTGQRCLKVYAAIERAVANHRKRVETAVLNEVVRDALLWQPPPASASKGAAKIYFVSQPSVSPPTIVFMCNNPTLFTNNYKRYLERKIRESLPFEGTPIRLVFRGKRLRDEHRDRKRRR
ncbi:hypothetical protein CTAYLR_006405 [Chrysophaeum taylorii]|uniref:GTPase Der n=1 Tax=Chrysophaeum taylorii TaxID=2483200 RepID=A0AAD7U9K4_9STRA|nr:hypothetical protein CTAYLR_006405 [Chrysophaeum taylorii]